MRILYGAIGLAFIAVALWDAFETVVLPRRVIRRIRLARIFYRNIWRLWKGAAHLIPSGRHRETYFSYFGPLSLILLISVWAFGLILGFALLHLAAGSALSDPEGATGFWTDLYLSGTTFFTLGLGDVAPRGGLARFITVLEAGMGFGFLALIIGYIPPLNQSFSRRETNISLLDARAGSPATAVEMLRRHAGEHGVEALTEVLADWELWSAELMESHLSYPVLAYFRSQHDNQSWLAALTTILDTCALVMVGVGGACERQARLTFAITLHAVLDISHVFTVKPKKPHTDRLPPSTLAVVREVLAASGLKIKAGAEEDKSLAELREMYEPYVHALSIRFRMSLPPWIPEQDWTDNWKVSAWKLPPGRRNTRHF